MSLTPESFLLSPHDWVPNNPRLPVLLYRNALGLPRPVDVANELESLFHRNGWPQKWRNGVYPFHHFHSNAHETLGFARGSARLVLGGPGGHEVAVNAGDVAVLPAGTGHCRLSSTLDFLVVGAYPPDQNHDLHRTAVDRKTLEQINQVPFPYSDPVTGANGALLTLWRKES